MFIAMLQWCCCHKGQLSCSSVIFEIKSWAMKMAHLYSRLVTNAISGFFIYKLKITSKVFALYLLGWGV